MIHPRKRSNPAKRWRVAVHLSGNRSAMFFGWNDARANLTLPEVAEALTSSRESQFWITPESDDWSVLAPTLLAGEWRINARQSRGKMTGVRVSKGGREWEGHDASSIVSLRGERPSPLDCAQETWRQLEDFDAYLRERFGVGLEVSVPRTALEVFRRHLSKPVGLHPAIAAELRDLQAYGGGNVQAFAFGGYSAPALVDASGRELVDEDSGEVLADEAAGPYEFDLPSAYATAMAGGDIPADVEETWTKELGSLPSWALERGAIVSAYVRVEGDYPPLRRAEGSRVYFPRGEFLFTGTPEELACPGVTILRPVKAFRFQARDEFCSFAEDIIKARGEVVKGSLLESRVKLMVNGFVGTIARNPWITSLSTVILPGSVYHSPGFFSVEKFSPAKCEILSAACTVTGRVRAKSGAALHAMHVNGWLPLRIDTDGGELFRAPHWHPPLAPTPDFLSAMGFRLSRVHSVEVFGAKQAIITTLEGEEKIKAAGLSRDLTAAELRGYESGGAITVRRRVEGSLVSVELRRLYETITSNRIAMGHGRTRPFDMTEIRRTDGPGLVEAAPPPGECPPPLAWQSPAGGLEAARAEAKALDDHRREVEREAEEREWDRQAEERGWL